MQAQTTPSPSPSLSPRSLTQSAPRRVACASGRDHSCRDIAHHSLSIAVYTSHGRTMTEPELTTPYHVVRPAFGAKQRRARHGFTDVSFGGCVVACSAAMLSGRKLSLMPSWCGLGSSTNSVASRLMLWLHVLTSHLNHTTSPIAPIPSKTSPHPHPPPNMMTSSVHSFLVNVVGLPLASSPSSQTPRDEQQQQRRRMSSSSSCSNYGHLVRLDHDGNPSFVKYRKTQRLRDVTIL